MDSAFVDKAIPMVSVNQNTGKYELTPQATQFLKAITGPIGVVSVAGLYRTGKSYLLNRMLLNRSNGFGVGPTVNPCTKGLWCWGTPLKGTSNDGEQVSIIVIDTEGIGALDEDQTHDTKIFTLAILASSCFIYNSMGSIDENAVQNLSLVVNLTKHIQLKAGQQDEEGEDPDEIAGYFPSFYWVVRDFSLQLQDLQGHAITSNQYLERALAPQNGFTDDIEEKNRIRRLLTAFFKERSCFTLIRPLVNEEKLQLLDKLDYDQLRPEFVEQVMKFRKCVLAGIKVKTLLGKKLTGEMYCSVMGSYVTAINEGAVPNIENAWNYMCEEQCSRLRQDCCALFDQEIKSHMRELPIPEEELNQGIAAAEEAALENFRQKAIGDRVQNYLKQLKQSIKTTVDELRQANIRIAVPLLKDVILKTVHPIQKKLTSQEYKTFQQFEQAVGRANEELMTRGPKLHNYRELYQDGVKKFLTQGAEFFFKSIKKEHDKAAELFRDKQAQYVSEIEKLGEAKESFRRKHMEAVATSDQRISELTHKVEWLQSQLDMTTQSKQEEEKRMEKSLSHKHQEMESFRKQLEEKCSQLKEKAEQESRTFANELKEWERERAVLDLKVKQQGAQLEELQKRERALESQLNVARSDSSFQVREIAAKFDLQRDELTRTVTELRERLTEVSEEYASTREDLESKIDKLEKRERKSKEDLTSRTKDLEKLKRDFDAEKKALRDEFETTREASTKQSEDAEGRAREHERTVKNLGEELKKQKHRLEGEIDLMRQRQQLLNSQVDRLKTNLSNLKVSHQAAIATYEQTYSQRREEHENRRISELIEQHREQVQSITTSSQAECKRLHFEFDTTVRKMEETREQYVQAKKQLEQSTQELGNLKERFRDETEFLRVQLRNAEKDKSSELGEREFYYEAKFKALEEEIEEVKEKAMQERRDMLRDSQETITQIRNNFEVERMALEKKLASEKDRAQKNARIQLEEQDRRYREEVETLTEELQQSRSQYENLMEQFRSMTNELQHELDISRKRAETLDRQVAELKELLNKREADFSVKFQNVLAQAKGEKEKLQGKVDALLVQGNRKEKELMSTTHQRDQYANSLEKKQAKILELQAQFNAQKVLVNAQKERIYQQYREKEAEQFNQIMTLAKESALYKQSNDHIMVRVNDLEKTLANSSQAHEDHLKRLKEERDLEIRTTFEKLTMEKATLEGKYKDFKTVAKEAETALKKALSDNGRDRAVAEEKVIHLEGRVKELEEKRSAEGFQLQGELAKVRMELTGLRRASGDEIAQLRRTVETLEGQRSDLSAVSIREKALLVNKVNFLENSKEETKREYEERIRKLEMQIDTLQNSRMMDKNTLDSQHSSSLKNLENNYRSKIQELTENLSKRTFQYESANKKYEEKCRDLENALLSERAQRESLQASAEKKSVELTDQLKRKEDELTKLKSDRDAKESEYRRREKDEKESFKSKLEAMEKRLKETENVKLISYLEYEKEKSKWQLQREQLAANISQETDMVKKLQKERDRLKSDVDKLKAEKKNNSNRTHSYLSNLKTTFIETTTTKPMEEDNKENLQYQ